jgi:hypothetical protein
MARLASVRQAGLGRGDQRPSAQAGQGLGKPANVTVWSIAGQASEQRANVDLLGRRRIPLSSMQKALNHGSKRGKASSSMQKALNTGSKLGKLIWSHAAFHRVGSHEAPIVPRFAMRYLDPAKSIGVGTLFILQNQRSLSP